MTHRIITGARGLVGQALTHHLAEAPGTLLAIDTAGDEASSTAEGQIHRADCRSADFGDLVTDFLRGAPRVELFHTAGFVPEPTHIADIDADAFRAVVDDNLTVAYAALRTTARIAAKNEVPGALTVLGSVGAIRAHRYKAAYDAAKAGVAALVRSFALEYGPHGISSRLVAIGPIAESSSTAQDGTYAEPLVRLVPLQRYAHVAEIAAAVAAFGSAAFDMANGHTLTLDGGLSQQLRPLDIERPPDMP